MLARAHAAGVLTGWVTVDEAYGQNPTFRGWLADREVPFVLATRNDDMLASPDGHRRQAKSSPASPGPARAAAGNGARSGPARTANGSTTGPPSPWTEPDSRRAGNHWLLVRRQTEIAPVRRAKSWRSTAAPAPRRHRCGS